MKVVTYMCENCLEPYEFNIDDKRENYICPVCGEKMMYWSTSDIDDESGLVTDDYKEDERTLQSPGKPSTSQYNHLNSPTITCPYCKSTDTKKISAWDRLGGVFASGKVSNNWHCNRCDSDF